MILLQCIPQVEKGANSMNVATIMVERRPGCGSLCLWRLATGPLTIEDRHMTQQDTITADERFVGLTAWEWTMLRRALAKDAADCDRRGLLDAAIMRRALYNKLVDMANED